MTMIRGQADNNTALREGEEAINRRIGQASRRAGLRRVRACGGMPAQGGRTKERATK